MSNFARMWFFASGPAVAPTATDWGGTQPKIVNVLHSMLAQNVREYQWAEIAPGGAVDGWFQPKDVQADQIIGAIAGVTILPHLADSTPVDAIIATLLKHAGVQPGDAPFTVIKKLCNFHQTDAKGFRHPGLRPQLY